VSARTPRHSAIDLLKGATTFIATLESERMPFTESTMIFIDAGCVTGVNKTIDECNADPISMRILEPYRMLLYVLINNIFSRFYYCQAVTN
jgi:hypothetical protein